MSPLSGPPKTSKAGIVILGTIFGIILFQIALWGGLIYAAIHFTTKFW